MLRWIVSISALIVVSSTFAQGSLFCNDGHNSDKNKSSFCNPTPIKCDPTPVKCDPKPIDCNPKPPTDCNPKPPTNCVPEPTSVAALAIGGIGFIMRKKKKA